jgi:hypothetical protein
MPSFFIEKNCSGDVGEIMIVDDSETHLCVLSSGEKASEELIKGRTRATRGYICFFGGVLIIRVSFRLATPRNCGAPTEPTNAGHRISK